MASKEDATTFFEEYTAKYPDDKSAIGMYVERIVRDKEPIDRGIELASKLKELAGYPRNADYQQYLAQLYVIKEDPAKAEEEYGKDFADGYISNAVYALTGYANFWIEQGKNLESVEAMADVVAAAIGAKKPDQSYTLSQVAGIYAGLDKTTRRWPSTVRRSPRRTGATRTGSRATPRSGTGRARTSRAPRRRPNGPSS